MKRNRYVFRQSNIVISFYSIYLRAMKTSLNQRTTRRKTHHTPTRSMARSRRRPRRRRKFRRNREVCPLASTLAIRLNPSQFLLAPRIPTPTPIMVHDPRRKRNVLLQVMRYACRAAVPRSQIMLMMYKGLSSSRRMRQKRRVMSRLTRRRRKRMRSRWSLVTVGMKSIKMIPRTTGPRT